jgi:hypothetical protein
VCVNRDKPDRRLSGDHCAVVGHGVGQPAAPLVFCRIPWPMAGPEPRWLFGKGLPAFLLCVPSETLEAQVTLRRGVLHHVELSLTEDLGAAGLAFPLSPKGRSSTLVIDSGWLTRARSVSSGPRAKASVHLCGNAIFPSEPFSTHQFEPEPPLVAIDQ